MSSLRRYTALSLTLTALVILTLLAPAAEAAPAPQPCSCLVYYQKVTGLPATGNAGFHAEDYANWLAGLRRNGRPVYRVTFLRPDTRNPGSLNGASLIFSHQKMNNAEGHIGIIESASYSSRSGRWTFVLRDANSSWAASQTIWRGTDHGCSNVKRVQYTPGDLGGLTFFRASGA